LELSPRAMSEPRRQSNLGFRFMSLVFRIRDMVRPPEKVLCEVDLRPGMVVLDYGCGPGVFSLAAARTVGPAGCVYALDIHPLAVRCVQRAAAKEGLSNIHTILGHSLAELASQSIDVILFYDVLHLIAEPAAVLEQMHRVLKPSGMLSVSDHHMKPQRLIAVVTAGDWFYLAGQGHRTFQFKPSTSDEPVA